jgi:hypothetical protein
VHASVSSCGTPIQPSITAVLTSRTNGVCSRQGCADIVPITRPGRAANIRWASCSRGKEMDAPGREGMSCPWPRMVRMVHTTGVEVLLTTTQ